MVSDDGVGADVGVGADAGGGSDSSSRVNARGVGGRLVEEFDSTGEGKVRIFEAEGGGWDLREVRLDENRRCLGGAGERGVFGIGDEGQITESGCLDAGDAGNTGGGVAVKGSTEIVG